MTKVVALQTWSNGTITMDEKSVAEIDDALATDLIAKGICADAATYFGGGGSGGGVLVVNETVSGETHTLDKTWQEIHDSAFPVIKKSSAQGISIDYIASVVIGLGNDYNVTTQGRTTYTASSSDGYPYYEETIH